MIFSQFKSAFKHPLNASILIISLAVGMACMNLIIFFIAKEYQADAFQKNRDRIYELYCNDPWVKGAQIYYTKYGAGEYMKNNLSEVEDYCLVTNANPTKVTVRMQDFFDPPQVIAASSNFFSFFSYQLLSNTPDQVLLTSQDLVISEKLARTYFGSANPIGEEIILTGGTEALSMVVTGVFRKPMESTHLNFDMVRLIGENDSRCYLLLDKNADANRLEDKLVQYQSEIPILTDGTPNYYFIKDMRSAYFDTQRNWTIENSRSKSDLTVAFVIAILILAVGLFNFLGLTHNRLIEKNKEHSIRRINGGSKRNLTISFLYEMVILIGTALLLSLLIMFLLMPFFNQLTLSSLSFTYIFDLPNGLILIIVPAIVLLITLWFVFFSLRKGSLMDLLQSGKKGMGRKHLPVFNIAQLAVSILLMVASVIIMKQINYISNKEIGLDRDVLEVRIPRQYQNVAPIFKEELEKHPQFKVISLANASPVLEHVLLKLQYEENGVMKEYMPSVFIGDQNYAKSLGIEILAGEDFSQSAASNQGKCIINESLASLFPGQDLIGRPLPGDGRMTVIGMAKDFHYGSLKQVIEPGYIAYAGSGFYLMAKPLPGQEALAKEVISDTWEEMIPDFGLNIESIGDRYEWMHRENSNYARLIGSCCFISLFLSMIGLFAVSYNGSKRRIKEIGIRRVNGALITEIMAMLNRDFVIWVGIAFFIATPVAYFAMDKWLQNFAYRTGLSWWVFAMAGLLALGIALITVSWQSYRAASRNPVEALRYE